MDTKTVRDKYRYPKLSSIEGKGPFTRALFFRTDADIADEICAMAKSKKMKTSAFLRAVMEAFVQVNMEDNQRQ